MEFGLNQFCHCEIF